MANQIPILLAVLVPFLSYRWGKQRHAEGKPITLDERLQHALLLWAVFIPAIILPSILLPPNIPPIDRLIGISILLAVATGPLAVYWFTCGVLRIVRRLEAA